MISVSPPFPCESLVNSLPFRSARSGPGREAAKRTLDGEDRSGIIRCEGKGDNLGGVGEWAELIGGSMSVELISVLIAVLAVGATLGGLILTSSRGLRQDMRRLDERISGLESQIGELRERMAHLEGLLEGLREAITGRIAAS